MKAKVEQSKAWLRRKFLEERKSIQEMADEAGCSPATIRRRLKENGLIK